MRVPVRAYFDIYGGKTGHQMPGIFNNASKLPEIKHKKNNMFLMLRRQPRTSFLEELMIVTISYNE